MWGWFPYVTVTFVPVLGYTSGWPVGPGVVLLSLIALMWEGPSVSEKEGKRSVPKFPWHYRMACLWIAQVTLIAISHALEESTRPYESSQRGADRSGGGRRSSSRPAASLAHASEKQDGRGDGVAVDDVLSMSLQTPSVVKAAPNSIRVETRKTRRLAAFDIDSTDLELPAKTISVVLPCSARGDYAVKTIRAVFESTPAGVLAEIIVVDDGSEPAIDRQHITKEMLEQYNARVIRHPDAIGLSGSRQTGGDAAKGDIIVFFDCHVAPQEGWHESFLKIISRNYRTIVLPTLTKLDSRTWTQVRGFMSQEKCYVTWDAECKHYRSNDPYVPMIPDGNLAISRRWWTETGGYDRHMLGWGGETLDQSLRCWLCGGEIVVSPKTKVAQLPDMDEKTRMAYKEVGDPFVNRARAAYGWFGDFSAKLDHFPTFRQRRANGWSWYGNVSNIHAVKEKLSCRPFTWFLRRFKNIYENAGLLPESVFMIEEEVSQSCLTYDCYAGSSVTAGCTADLRPCDPKDDRQYWHESNTCPIGRCCSGLRAWNTDQCLQSVRDGRMITGTCDISGGNTEQHWKIADGELHGQDRDQCIGLSDRVAKTLDRRPCGALAGLSGKEHNSFTPAKWKRGYSVEPLESQLYRQAKVKHRGLFAELERQLERQARARKRSSWSIWA
eukprot:TRINITY_DN120700_c0_g1_i1.p1 TRINITY_DN120700_c0_g1~~TRINITY_DN120700_c0_g1_i1.p1  ORF type:complete len:784 (+),score=97.92 TRINITY_DN120700_c0_g1_i1:352-2352(+)